ncbi:MAG: hypothetical protein U5L96_06460 [Owenweeksia sp.]|nr:hypothetical protein [Owenweeksia sp.]
MMNETDRLCNSLDELGVTYFRNPQMNIVSIHAGQFPRDLCAKYRLVADNFDDPRWWKIVVMPHTIGQVMNRFLNDLKESLQQSKDVD